MGIGGSRQGKYEKPDLLFTNGDALSLNANNRRTLIHATARTVDDWIGKVIELSLGTVEFQGKEQESVVVKPCRRCFPGRTGRTGREGREDREAGL